MNKQVISVSDKLATWRQRMLAVPPKLVAGAAAGATTGGEGFALPGCEVLAVEKKRLSFAIVPKQALRSLKWFVRRGAPLAAALSPLLILHSAGGLTDTLRYTELRLGDLIQANTVSKEPEPAAVADNHGPVGRPLNMDETPVSHHPTQRGLLLRKVAWVNEEIDRLLQDGLDRQAALMKGELERARRMPEYSDGGPETTRKMMAVLAPLFSHVEQARLRRGLAKAKAMPVEALYRATASDPKKHGAILPGQYYFAEGNVGGIEQVTPITLPGDWTSYASGGSYVYFCTAEGLYSLHRSSGAVAALWYPGETVPKHIAIDGDKTFMLVRGDKDYRLELATGDWTVLDSLNLPAGPVGLPSFCDSIYVPGRIDDGLLGYIHVYTNQGALSSTLKLRQPIRIASRDRLRIEISSDKNALALISEDNTGTRDIVMIELAQGGVIHSGKLSLTDHPRMVVR